MDHTRSVRPAAAFRRWRASAVGAAGWGREAGDSRDALVASAYGRWVDRFYVGLGVLLLPVAVGDLVTYALSGAPVSLAGPVAMVLLCAAYLRIRRRFRRFGFPGPTGRNLTP